MPSLDKERAMAIARKLGATIDQTKAGHDMAEIFHDGRFVAKFGIRRGSRKDQGHGHIPKSLFVHQQFALGLALCNKTKDDWLEAMREQGLIRA